MTLIRFFVKLINYLLLMANIMSLKNVKNHVHRNGFDLSFRNGFSSKVGEILPVMCKEVLPGDVFKIKNSSFCRTRPVQTAAFTRIREYYDFYFVPTRLLWDKFPSYIIQTQNYTHAKDILSSPDNLNSHPYISLWDLIRYLYALKARRASGLGGSSDENVVGLSRFELSLKLLDYLDYGNWYDFFERYPTENDAVKAGKLNQLAIAINPFPFLAYQKIYQDYFRFDQWEPSAPYRCSLDYIFTNDKLMLDVNTLITTINNVDGSNIVHALRPTLFDVNYCNYPKDMFTGLLPSPQFGDTVIASPLMGDIVGTYSFVDNNNNYPKNGDVIFGNFGQLYDKNGQLRGNINIHSGTREPGSNLPPNSAGISVFALRMAEFAQKYREVTNCHDLDYQSQLAAHWNVNTSEWASDKCQYIGGSYGNININEVVNNNLYQASSNSSYPEADIAGKGAGVTNGSISYKAREHGYLMCIYHSVPILDWASCGIDKLNLKTKASDYAIPEFDNLGMESLRSEQLLFSTFKTAVDSSGKTHYTDVFNFGSPIGYAPRYIDYKTSIDKIHGSFLRTDKDWVTTMSPWYISRRLGSPFFDKMLTSSFFRVRPDILDSIFFLNADSNLDTDQFLNAVFFDIKVVRNLSTDGLPY